MWAALPGFDTWQGKISSLHHNVQAGSGIHTASYSMETDGDFTWSEAAGA
jgi:hypothetical protein